MPNSSTASEPLHPLLITFLTDGLLLPTQATTISNLQKSSKKSVEYLLLALGLISERTLQGYLQQQFGVESLIDPFELPDPQAIEKVSKSSAGKSKVIPQKDEAGSLYVLAVPPIKPNAIERIGKKSGLMVVPMVITELRFKFLMEQYYGTPMDAEEHLVAREVLEGINQDHLDFERPDLAIYDPYAGPPPTLPSDDPLDIAKLPVQDSELSLFEEFKQDLNLLMEDSIKEFTDEQQVGLRPEDTSGLGSHALDSYSPLVAEEITSLLSTVQSRDDLPHLFYSLGSNNMRTATLLTCADDFAMGWTGAGLGLLPSRLEGIIVPEDHGTFVAEIIKEGVLWTR